MSDKSQVTTYEDIGHKELNTPISRECGLNERRAIHVTWFERAGTLTFTMITKNGDIKPGGESTISSCETTVTPLLNQVAAFIKEAIQFEALSQSAKESQELSLAGFGKRLFNKIVPKETIEEILNWPKGCWVTISTNEQWIPWELLYCQDSFLVDRFVLFRLPRIKIYSKEKQKRDKTKDISSALKMAGSSNTILHVIGGNLTGDRMRKSDEHFQRRDKSIKLVRLEREKVADLAKNICKATIVHFTCHGHADPLRLQVSETDNQVFNLTIQAMEVIDVKEGGIVFVNACNSGATEIIFDEFTNFGWEFYKKGTAAFIGTLGTVPIDGALQFAQLFYDRFFTKGDLCKAFTKARESTTGPVRLLYCIYANPLSLSKIQLGMWEGE